MRSDPSKVVALALLVGALSAEGRLGGASVRGQTLITPKQKEEDRKEQLSKAERKRRRKEAARKKP